MKEDKTQKSQSGKYGLNLEALPEGYILDDRYRIEERIGIGGFGTVYKAWDNDLDTIKAIKVISKEFYNDEEVIYDLKKEAKLLYKLKHKNIVDFHDIHLDGEIKYIDMEFIDNGNLVNLKLRSPNKKVPEKEVIAIAKQIITGMVHIHSRNIIHKDIKPQNIMLTKAGIVKIMDFGISETFRSSMSRIKETSRSGTPAYMSPEQLIGKDVGKESDIWSFGVMLYELLSGKQLYSGQFYNDVLMQIEKRKVNSIDNVSEKLNTLLQKCLQYNYEDRFQYFEQIENYLLRNFEEEKRIKIKEKLEKERLEKEAQVKFEVEKLHIEKIEKEQKEREEQERLEKIEEEKREKIKEKLEKERLDKEAHVKLEAEKQEKLRIEKIEKEQEEREEQAKSYLKNQKELKFKRIEKERNNKEKKIKSYNFSKIVIIKLIIAIVIGSFIFIFIGSGSIHRIPIHLTFPNKVLWIINSEGKLGEIMLFLVLINIAFETIVKKSALKNVGCLLLFIMFFVWFSFLMLDIVKIGLWFFNILLLTMFVMNKKNNEFNFHD